MYMKIKSDNKPSLIDDKFLLKVKKRKTEFNNNNIKNDTFNCIYFSIRKNLGVIILFSLLVILLYQRYLDVQNRKKKDRIYLESF